jgi:serine/threonine protein kinase
MANADVEDVAAIENVIEQLQSEGWNGWIKERELGTGAYSKAWNIAINGSGHPSQVAVKISRWPIAQIEKGATVRSAAIKKEYSRLPVVKTFDDLNLIKLYDFRTVNAAAGNGGEYVVSVWELCIESLDKWLLNMPRDVVRSKAIHIALQIANGLDCLREKNWCHRDVGPRNVFVYSNDPIMVKVGDFGSAREVPQNEKMSFHGGTHETVPPEQLDGEFHVSQDIYSLAITTVFLLTGEWLFGDLVTKEDVVRSKLRKQNANDVVAAIARVSAFNFDEEAANVVLDAVHCDCHARWKGSAVAWVLKLKKAIESKQAKQTSPGNEEIIQTLQEVRHCISEIMDDLDLPADTRRTVTRASEGEVAKMLFQYCQNDESIGLDRLWKAIQAKVNRATASGRYHSPITARNSDAIFGPDVQAKLLGKTLGISNPVSEFADSRLLKLAAIICGMRLTQEAIDDLAGVLSGLNRVMTQYTPDGTALLEYKMAILCAIRRPDDQVISIDADGCRAIFQKSNQTRQICVDVKRLLGDCHEKLCVQLSTAIEQMLPIKKLGSG